MPMNPKPDAASTTRRDFCSKVASCWGAAALVGTGLPIRAVAQATSGPAWRLSPPPPATPSRPDVAAVDHDRILAAAGRSLNLAPTPLTALPCPRSPGTVHDYYSESESDTGSATNSSSRADPYLAHRDALYTLGLAVPALAAAYLLTADERYAAHALLHLRVWFVNSATRMTPKLDFGATPLSQTPPADTVGGTFQGILETLPLVEIAQAIPFLAVSPVFSEAELKRLQAWFAAYLDWLTRPEDSGPRLPALARDRKDHHGTSWLLQVSAYSSLAVPPGDISRSEDNALAALRHRFQSVTLRAQISSDGKFPHELSTDTPYRNSLFNLDMLAAVCQLLSTRFDNLWDYSLEDGPGMRAAIAYHFPFISDRTLWPFRADVSHFSELPCRRASLLFCARAYQRPEYAALWKTLKPESTSPDIDHSVPIHQPLLWVSQPPRPA
jgi:hypothetical protein